MADKINLWRSGVQVAGNYKFLVMPQVYIECYGTFHRLSEPDRAGVSRYGWQFLYPMGKDDSEVDPSILHEYNTRFDMERCDVALLDELDSRQQREQDECMRSYRAWAIREGKDGWM